MERHGGPPKPPTTRDPNVTVVKKVEPKEPKAPQQ